MLNMQYGHYLAIHIFLDVLFIITFYPWREESLWRSGLSELRVSNFELQSGYYVHFQTNTFWEKYKCFYPTMYRLNSMTAIQQV